MQVWSLNYWWWQERGLGEQVAGPGVVPGTPCSPSPIVKIKSTVQGSRWTVHIIWTPVWTPTSHNGQWVTSHSILGLYICSLASQYTIFPFPFSNAFEMACKSTWTHFLLNPELECDRDRLKVEVLELGLDGDQCKDQWEWPQCIFNMSKCLLSFKLLASLLALYGSYTIYCSFSCSCATS